MKHECIAYASPLFEPMCTRPVMPLSVRKHGVSLQPWNAFEHLLLSGTLPCPAWIAGVDICIFRFDLFYLCVFHCLFVFLLVFFFYDFVVFKS